MALEKFNWICASTLAFLELLSELKKFNIYFRYVYLCRQLFDIISSIILANILGRFENAIYKSTINQMKENDH